MENANARRPYAAAANVIAVMARIRTRNLPDSIDNDFLRIAGVGEAVYGRVLYALQFLDLVSSEGAPTDRLKSIASAPEQEYRQLLADAVHEAYQDDFRSIDPAEDAQSRILDAFRKYEPRSQIDRMVMLFLGLCREAGLPVKDAPRERSMKPVLSRTSASSSKRRPETRVPTPPITSATASTGATSGGLLFGVSETDVAGLSQEDFDEVWAALGKVARARAQRLAAEAATSRQTDDSNGDED